jgi:hypothetical protein
MTEVTIDARIRGVDPTHTSIQGAWAELRRDLREVPGLHVRERDLPSEGPFKGWQTEIIAALTATGTITGFVNILKLGRDRRRSIKVTMRTGDEETVYCISGENISVDALRDALQAAVSPEQDSQP